jgi:hypothetical protein
MYDLLNEGQVGDFRLDKFEITHQNRPFTCDIPVGKYIRLMDKYDCIMSDTLMEMRTNREVVDRANGDVFMAGLGIGLIVLPMQEKGEVRSITILEKYAQVIELVAGQLPLNGKVKIIQGDVFTYEFPRGTKYDTIYFDIWNNINSDIYKKEMKLLKKKYKKYLRPVRENRKVYMGCWAEAEAKKAELVEAGLPGTTIDQYNFYRAVSIVCDGMITLTKRYSRLAAEKAAQETDPARKKELETMAEVLDWCMEKPCRTFHEAVQCLFMYQTCLCLDANMHGMSFGRVDQYLGDFYENDLKAGRITPEYAQELMDLFYLKVAEMNKPWSYFATQANPGYTSRQLMTLGGVAMSVPDC